MRKSLSIIFMGITAFLFVGCHGDYRPEATGPINKITVIMDSTMWQSKTADAIRSVYGKKVRTVAISYPLFDLSFRDFTTQQQLNNLLRNRNIIFAAPLEGDGTTAIYIRSLLGDSVKNAVKKGQYFAFPLQDQWYQDQWTMILTSTSDSVLAQKIKSSAEQIRSGLLETTFQRYRQLMFSTGEQTDIEKKLWDEHGWKVRVPPSWNLHIDTTYTQKNGAHTGFVTFHNKTTYDARWLWAWWTDKPPSEDLLTSEWINQARDSLLKKYFRGSLIDSSYVTTDYKHFPVLVDTLKINGNTAYESRGVWRMTHGAMGGPFISMTIPERQNGRLFLLGDFQFAPKYRNKRRFVRRFRTILRTFQSDSTWNRQKENHAK